jgi:hypothetical protein
MTQLSTQTVVAFPELLAGIGAFLGALIVAGVLLLLFFLGARRVRRDSPRPGPEDQPRLPEGGPVQEERERREPDELTVREEAERLYPHELKGFGNAGSKRSDDQKPRRWSPGSSGSFGSGGMGGRR